MTSPLLSLLLTAVIAVGQEPPPQEPAPSLEAARESLALVESGSAPDKTELAALYRQAIDELERARVLEAEATEFERLTQEAPTLLETLRTDLAQPLEPVSPALPPEAGLRDLEQNQLQADADRTAAQRLVEELGQEALFRTQRLTSIAGEIATIGQKITEAQDTLGSLSGEDAMAMARRTLAGAQLAALRTELRKLQSERTCYEARRELLPLRRERAQRRLTRAEQLSTFWQSSVAARRQVEAEALAREAERQRKQVAARFPRLGSLARENEELAAYGSGSQSIPAQIAEGEKALMQAQRLLKEGNLRFSATRRKVTVAGLNEVMGEVLRRELEWLPSPAQLRAESSIRKAQLSQHQLLLITQEEKLENSADLGTQHANLLEELPAGEDKAAAEQVSVLARELLESQRANRTKLIADLGSLINNLLEQERVHSELVALSTAFRSYIRERILWVRSTSRSPIEGLGDYGRGLAWLWGEWPRALAELGRTVADRLLLTSFLGLLIAALFVSRRWIHRRVSALGDDVRSFRTDHFSYTLRAFLATSALAAPISLLLWFTGELLDSPATQTDQALAVGYGLRQVAPIYFVLSFFRQSSLKKHLADSHFRWSSKALKQLRKVLLWFTPAYVATSFVALTYNQQATPQWTNTLGRLAFILSLALLAVGLHRLFRRDSPLLPSSFKRGGSLLARTHGLWFALAQLLPIGLIGCALAGYYYTAVQLERSLRESLGFVALLILVNAMLMRWLFMARRRLAIEQARQRAITKSEQSEVDPAAARESGSAAVDEDSIDIPAVDIQTRRLFRSGIAVAAVLGLLFIWADSLPALNALERVQIWPELGIISTDEFETQAVAGDLEGSTPEELPESGAGTTIVTLADLGQALLILLLTGIASTNVPGLLEISLLQRLPLDSGSRYAVSTLCRYGIMIAGTSAGFSALGIGWDKVQWLAAALTFGLAFGLQEIFANFVSGLIILIERPVRVGDIVTVGTTEGRVTRLRMRATTILDWDRREMLVPNKEFITGSVTNWTLSDPVTRLTIPVGIAYGSDVKLARSLLMKAAQGNELVLKDPAPSAIFKRFGDSSLEFNLRIFMANRDLWPQIIDRLHAEIDATFREAGVEIAFPQRDLHIRSAEGLRGLSK